MLSLTLTEASDADAAARRGVLEGTAFCRPRSRTTFYCWPRNS